MAVKRSRVVFVVAIWSLLGLGYVITRTRTIDPDDRLPLEVPIEVELPPLVAPRGETHLEGTVVEADGAPAADCQVSLFREELEPGTAEPLHWTFTDEQGRFVFEDLHSGPYRVALLTPSAPPTTLSIEAPQRAPVLWTLKPPIPPLEVLPDLERTSIAGRISLPDGFDPAIHNLRDYEICLIPAVDTPQLSGAVIRRELTDELGNFHFPQVALADYRLEVLPPWARGGTWPVLAQRELTAGRALGSALEVRLEIGALSGRVTSIEDHVIEGALVKVFPVGESAARDRFWPPENTDALGKFLVGDLPTGNYLVRVRAGADAVQIEATVRAGEVTAVSIDPLDTRRGD